MAEPAHDMSLSEGWRALRPFVRRLSGAGWWLMGGLALGVLALTASLGLLGLSGAFLTGAAIAGLHAGTAATFNFFLPGAGVRLFAVLRTTARWGERVLAHEGTFRLLAGLRCWLYGHLSRLSPGQLMRYHGAELLDRLVRDIDALDNLYPRLLMPLVAAGLLFAALTVVFACVVPSLVWMPVLLGCMALFGLPASGWRLGRALLPAWMRERAALRMRLLDAWEGLEDFSLHRPAWARQRARVQVTQTAWLTVQARSHRRAAGLRAVVALLVGVMAWVALGLLGGEAPQARLPGPWVAALVLLLLGCAEALQPLVAASIDLPGTASAAQRVQAIADEVPRDVYPAHGPAPADASIDVQSLHFSWDADSPVFSGWSLRVAPGEHLLLTGESGCGKSSLIQLLTRMAPADRGRILLGGVPIEALDEATLRAHVACATQFTWAQTATLADNLRLARPEATDAEMTEVLNLVGLDPASAGWRHGLDTWIDEGGANLSGGQRRRLAVARALLRRAPITLLDEPSEGLDLAAEQALLARVSAHLQGRTLIWVSHRTVDGPFFHRTVCLASVPPVPSSDRPA